MTDYELQKIMQEKALREKTKKSVMLYRLFYSSIATIISSLVAIITNAVLNCIPLSIVFATSVFTLIISAFEVRVFYVKERAKYDSINRKFWFS